jgi:hypothetical protein
MEAWLISWMPAGHDAVDRIVTVLPAHFEPAEVRRVAETVFYIGAFTPAETVHHRLGSGMKPQVYISTHANDYVRINIDFGSAALSARRVRNLQVSDDKGYECFSWEEQNHDGKWAADSYRRSRQGTITFNLE